MGSQEPHFRSDIASCQEGLCVPKFVLKRINGSGFVARMVVRIDKCKNEPVGARSKVLQDDRIAARVSPHPGRIVEIHMDMPDMRRGR
jgi:hypothetical protein